MGLVSVKDPSYVIRVTLIKYLRLTLLLIPSKHESLAKVAESDVEFTHIIHVYKLSVDLCQEHEIQA